MRIVCVVGLTLAAGCQFHPTPARVLDGPLHPDGKVMPDADTQRPDSMLLPDAQTCFGSGSFQVCDQPPPTGATMLPGMISTDVGSSDCGPAPSNWPASQPDACFVYGATITMGAMTKVHGARPLVLVASDSIIVSGVLDVSSHRGGTTGPGGNYALCSAFAGNAGNDQNGAGGGAGGSFITFGGNGGQGNGTNQVGQAGSRLSTPTTLHGGCPGQTGGDGGNGTGPGGDGGGAVYSVAGSTITIAGVIDASGAGGSKGDKNSGGSGGGSGGMIVLDAPVINAESGASLIANGGGGSAGGDDNGGGMDGKDPSAPWTAASAGGNGPGGTGGSGSYGSGAGGPGIAGGNNNNQGGGGGGGGAGYIRANVAIGGTAVTSPTIEVVP